MISLIGSTINIESNVSQPFSNSPRLKSRGCYFLRNIGADKPIKLDTNSDNELEFGEISS
jgi:hypothetical protein